MVFFKYNQLETVRSRKQANANVAGQTHYVPQNEIVVMPEGINRASRSKRPGFPLTDCGNDDFEAAIFDFMVILQVVFT